MICEYGNCHEQDKLPILVSTRGRAVDERKRFCSEYHAALWLLAYAVRNEHNPERREAALVMFEMKSE